MVSLQGPSGSVATNVGEKVATENENIILASAKGASYYYGDDDYPSVVLQNINFSVSKGELLVVVGPVGAGRSLNDNNIILPYFHKIHQSFSYGFPSFIFLSCIIIKRKIQFPSLDFERNKPNRQN